MPTLSDITPAQGNSSSGAAVSGEDDYPRELEQATRALLELNVAVLDEMNKAVGIASLRALQTLERRGPIKVTELGNDLGMLVSTASRLSDRLTEAGLITRTVSPANRRATLLELSDQGRALLERLTETRISALRRVTDQMSSREQRSLLIGARAFTRARLLDPQHPAQDRDPGSDGAPTSAR